MAKTEQSLSRQVHNLGQFVGNVLESVNVTSPSPEGMEETWLALHTAIEQGDVDSLRETIADSEVDLNRKFDASVSAAHAGITPLALACALNKQRMVQVLLESGANVNTPFATLNTTALMTSCYHGHIEVVEILLEHGADVAAVDLQQSTALGYAFGGTRSMKVIDLLLRRHVDVNQPNMLGMSALLLVAGYGNDLLVRRVLDSNANPMASNDFGHTALHLAVVGKHDMLTKMQRLGSADAASADRTLNRRNLDVAMQEWARLHRSALGDSREREDALARAGRFMMSVGVQLDEATDSVDERQQLRQRVEAVRKLREMKLDVARQQKKSGLWGFLACAGSKAKQLEQRSGQQIGAKPYSEARGVDDAPATGGDVSQLNDSFSRILRMLIESGCPIDAADRTFGMTALDLAILRGDVESSAQLVSAGGDPDHFLKVLALKDLYNAVSCGDKRTIKELLAIDDDLDVNQSLTRFTVEDNASDEGLTPLSYVARLNDVDSAKLLLRRGAHINSGGVAEVPPLVEAAQCGNKRMVDFLLSAGADLEITAPPKQGATAVASAALAGRLDVVDLLIKRGAKVDRVLSDNTTGLLRCVEARDEVMIDKLLSADLQHNISDPQSLPAKLAAEYQSRQTDQPILDRVVQSFKKVSATTPYLYKAPQSAFKEETTSSSGRQRPKLENGNSVDPVPQRARSVNQYASQPVTAEDYIPETPVAVIRHDKPNSAIDRSPVRQAGSSARREQVAAKPDVTSRLNQFVERGRARMQDDAQDHLKDLEERAGQLVLDGRAQKVFSEADRMALDGKDAIKSEWEKTENKVSLHSGHATKLADDALQDFKNSSDFDSSGPDYLSRKIEFSPWGNVRAANELPVTSTPESKNHSESKTVNPDLPKILGASAYHSNVQCGDGQMVFDDDGNKDLRNKTSLHLHQLRNDFTAENPKVDKVIQNFTKINKNLSDGVVTRTTTETIADGVKQTVTIQTTKNIHSQQSVSSSSSDSSLSDRLRSDRMQSSSSSSSSSSISSDEAPPPAPVHPPPALSDEEDVPVPVPRKSIETDF